MNGPVLKMQGIEKRFGGVRALRSVDFVMKAGRVYKKDGAPVPFL